MKKLILTILLIVGLNSCQKWSDTKAELLRQGYTYEIDIPSKMYYVYSKGVKSADNGCAKLIQPTTLASSLKAPSIVCGTYTITDLREVK